MALRFLKKIFSGKKETPPIGSIACQDDCYICGLIMADGSVEGDKYNHGKLIASGRFLDGRLHGQGKRYNEGRIMCEGNFIDGHLSGEGKMYSHFGHVIYEGTFAKKPNDYGSAYHGQGREYGYKTGALLYEGDFFYNHWRGHGREYYPDGQLRYEGEFLDNFWHGQGQHYDQNGKLVYAGDFTGVTLSYDR
ncbi:hypothetical protein FXB42_06735 [Acetobacterium wieringae]|jgi:antitoxin component YwqK of YwqJK toxin-antitoxin module|uniref:MORN repeat protein n=1 Tax=Acetobacterium wieringae TaxID=52694 RepID=A0A5D0WQS3_9FIRM|nr:hypothetical protein [Acetobacterium wieringae]TYC86376.1 hypothetical protein FXB42_06735 [Acetobacterium wieringae]